MIHKNINIKNLVGKALPIVVLDESVEIMCSNAVVQFRAENVLSIYFKNYFKLN